MTATWKSRLHRWYLAARPLLLVLIVGVALRAYDITVNPSELITDELDLYNSAHSIATTGHDIDGSLLPYLSSSFTRNPPMYAIAEYVTSLVFGNGPFGLRLPAIAFGTLAIVLIYAIAFELTRRRDVAIAAAIVQATQPIFVAFSRIAWEPASELPFLLGGLYALLRAFRRDPDAPDGRDGVSGRALAVAAVLLALTSYTYMAGWFYAVALGAPVLALNVLRLRTRRAFAKVAAAAALFGIVAWPALWMWFGNDDTYARTNRIATFRNGITPEALERFAANYAAHFHWTYLVTTGDPISGATWRYLAGFGAFYWWVIPAAALGAVVASRYVRARWALAWLWLWLAIYPFGGALTDEAIPNAPRTLAGAPVFCLFASIGLVFVLDRARSVARPRARTIATRAVATAFALNLALSVALFSRFFFTQFPLENPNAWDSGTRELFGVIHDRAPAYRRLCISVRPAWYNTETYLRYYLGDTKIDKIEDITDPACFLPGTLLATDRLVERPGFRHVATVDESGGLVFAIVAARG